MLLILCPSRLWALPSPHLEYLALPAQPAPRIDFVDPEDHHPTHHPYLPRLPALLAVAALPQLDLGPRLPAVLGALPPDHHYYDLRHHHRYLHHLDLDVVIDFKLDLPLGPPAPHR